VPVPPNYGARQALTTAGDRDGLIIGVVATDAPLPPHHLERLEQRTARSRGPSPLATLATP